MTLMYSTPCDTRSHTIEFLHRSPWQLPTTGDHIPVGRHITRVLPPLGQLAEQVAKNAAPAQLAGQLPSLDSCAVGTLGQLRWRGAAAAMTPAHSSYHDHIVWLGPSLLGGHEFLAAFNSYNSTTVTM
jgi:hypothetical protein